MPQWGVAKSAETTCVVTGRMRIACSKRCGDGGGDKDILSGAVFGSVTCSCVILYFAHIMHTFSSKLYATDLVGRAGIQLVWLLKPTWF